MQSGDTVPDFTLQDAAGELTSLSGLLAGGPLALFFYPAAMSYGCTKESCHFRDLAGEFRALGAGRVGVSADSVETLARFRDENHFDYPLLSDPDGTVARLFGVRRSFSPLPTKRWTFVIDQNAVVRSVIKNELRMDRHADLALEALRSLAPNTGAGGDTPGASTQG